MPDIYINAEGSSVGDSGDKPENNKLKKKKKTKKQEHTQTYLDLISKNKDALDGYTNNPLAAFGYVPESVTFDAIEDGENVVLFLRQHPVTNVLWIIGVILMALAPLLLTIFPIFSSVPDNFKLIIVLSWYLLILLYSFEKFLNWLFNIYIVTDERVVDIDFHNLLYKNVSSASLGRVQDVSYKQVGSFATLFNYGDVRIQTAAEKAEFEYLRVPQPKRVVNVIRDLIEEFKLTKAKEFKDI